MEAFTAGTRAGAGSFTVHHPSMTDRRTEEAALAEQLETALAQGQFEVVYQPVISIAAREVTGFEALLRWHSPTRGFVLPGLFIPVLEEIGRAAAQVARDTKLQIAFIGETAAAYAVAVVGRGWRVPRA